MNSAENGMRTLIISHLTMHEKVDDYLIKRLSEVDESKTHFYSDALEYLIKIEIPEDEARRIWEDIIMHMAELQQSLGRNVGLKVAALDYFLNKHDSHGEMYEFEINAYRQQARLSMLDDLTGMFNRTYFEMLMQKELRRSVRYNRIFTLVFFAPDKLDDMMEEKSELFFMQLLKSFSSLTQNIVRAEDTLCRYTEEKFAFMLPETNSKGGVIFAQRIQQLVKRFPMYIEHEVTFSAGIASYPQDGVTTEELQSMADATLFRAQHEGKDLVVKSDKGQRKHKRFTMTWRVTFEVLEGESVSEVGSNECITQDVSLGGMNLESTKEMQIDTKLLLTLRPTTVMNEFVKVVGVIRQRKKLNVFRYDYGIEFYNIKDDSIKKLKRILPLHDVRMG